MCIKKRIELIEQLAKDRFHNPPINQKQEKGDSISPEEEVSPFVINVKAHRRAHLLGKSLVLARRKWEIDHEEDLNKKNRLKGLVQNTANKEKQDDEEGDTALPATYVRLPLPILLASWLYTCRAEAKRTFTYELQGLGVKPVKEFPIPRPAFAKHLLLDDDEESKLLLGKRKVADEAREGGEKKMAVPKQAEGSTKKTRTDYSSGEAHYRLVAALQACGKSENEDGTKPSINSIAKQYNLPFSVLYNRCNGKYSVNARPGADTLLAPELESLILDHCLEMDKYGFPLTQSQLRHAAVEIAGDHGITLQASNKWIALFFDRHPEITKRRSQVIGRTRAGGMNVQNCNEWFGILSESYDFIMVMSGVQEVDPCFIWNLDETGISQDVEKGMVICRTGKTDCKAQQVQATGNNRLTSVNIISGGDWTMPPFFIFEGKEARPAQRLTDDELRCLQPGSDYAFTKCGYMDNETWDNRVVPWIIREAESLRKKKNNPAHWVMLILDGFGAHCYSPSSLQLLYEAKIRVLKMPSQTSSALQPLDVSVFHTLKSRFRGFCNDLAVVCSRAMDKYALAFVVESIWKHYIQKGKDGGDRLAKSGFRQCGIYPLDMNWVEKNKKTLGMSDPHGGNALGTQDLVRIGAEEGVEGCYNSARDVQLSRRLIDSGVADILDKSLQENAHMIGGDAKSVGQSLRLLLGRVASKELPTAVPADRQLTPKW